MNNKLLMLCFSLIVGCSSSKEDFKNRSVESIYKKGLALLKARDYTEAASEFKDIETLFPYSSKANEGQVLAAYCHFLAASYQDAVREIEIFLRYHPSNELVPYAMYLKGMCIYMQTASIGRDSKNALESKQVFVELINKFPESKYYKDSLKKIMILDDIIAAQEMMIGRYYQKNKNPIGAIGRYMFVTDKLSHTVHAEEAYFRIIECCHFVGLKEEAMNAYKILVSQYPKSSWTKKAKPLTKKII
ncbi:MAG: outer membrane protein assembly factor BamD [Holosporaceae bacterium]|jgi:outer membrane protein assembly factor BamD|nr:outer membrane protein assembly factor BamD [Holosporaceae bacterium]